MRTMATAIMSMQIIMWLVRAAVTISTSITKQSMSIPAAVTTVRNTIMIIAAAAIMKKSMCMNMPAAAAAVRRAVMHMAQAAHAAVDMIMAVMNRQRRSCRV